MKNEWPQLLKEALAEFKAKQGKYDVDIGEETGLGQSVVYRFRESKAAKNGISFHNAELLARYLGYDLVKRK